MADELVRAALAGDQRAWVQLFARLDAELRRYFGRRFPPADVDDLVQATLAAVLPKLDTFEERGDDAFIRWVYGFARFETQKAIRSRTRRDHRHAALERADVPENTNLSSKIERVQRMAIVRRELKRLRAAQRRAIENELAGGDAGMLAAAEKIGRNAARMLRTRARRKLRALVRERMANPRVVTPSPSTPSNDPT